MDKKRIIFEAVLFVLAIGGLLAARPGTNTILTNLYYTDGFFTTCKSTFFNFTTGVFIGNITFVTVGGRAVTLYKSISGGGTCTNPITGSIALRP